MDEHDLIGLRDADLTHVEHALRHDLLARDADARANHALGDELITFLAKDVSRRDGPSLDQIHARAAAVPTHVWLD